MEETCIPYIDAGRPRSIKGYGCCKYTAYSKNTRLAATVNIFSIQKPVETLCNPRRGGHVTYRFVPGRVRGGHVTFRFVPRKRARRSHDAPFCGPRRSRDAPFRGHKKVTWGRTSRNTRRRRMESDQQPMRR
ncbi:hypothetical protein chiPu_0000179 [Chiloscyllium punctatum]|uniref:Uncharacterized protein n=1 Tax=Chiloscyllium punctatum TaxID=137246 RepID=A0A401RSB3_CHIPU|nr:hypothetical protein [Chiloscyllium punctatum]